MNRPISKNSKIGVAAAVLSSLLVVTPPASAQGDWFDSIKSFLGLGEEKAATPLTEQQTAQGLKELLSQSAQSMIAKLGQQGSFENNSDLHIQMPQSLQGVGKALEKVGMGDYFTQIEQKLNQAAETIIPKAGPAIQSAISKMKLEDAQSLYQGGGSAATDYLKKTMEKPIGDAITPIVKQTLADLGVTDIYKQAMEKYNAIPLLPKADGDLIGTVQAQATKAIFKYLGQEETAIRQDPSKQSTDLLKQMFEK